MEELSQRAILEETAARILAQKRLPNILEHAFDKQVAFIKHPAKKKLLFCSRRSAKSYTAILFLLEAMINHPGCNTLFFGLTRSSAKAIVWKDILKVIDTQYGLNCRFNETDLTVVIPNGSMMYVLGMDSDESEMLKVLGRKFKRVAGDEGSMYTIDLRKLVELLEPSLIDQDGDIGLFGTASDFPRGYFYDITVGTEPGWEIFKWSAYDNPYVADKWAAAIQKIKDDRPLYMETPQFRQWYLNEWVVDEEKLVYRFDMAKNLAIDLPRLSADGWTFVLGVDTGWEDDSAFVLTGYHTNFPHMFVIKSYHKKKMTFDDVVLKIQDFMADKEYAPHRVIIDGANKQGVESMRQRSSIPFEFADKQDKATFIELCNSDLIQGTIKMINSPDNRDLWQEMASLVWMTDGDKLRYPKKEHPALSNHLCDAFLYAWRCGWHYASTPAVKQVVMGSRDWYDKQSEEIWERERERLTELESNWPAEGSLGDLG